MEHDEVGAVLDLDAALHAEQPFLALMPDQLVLGFLGGVDRDDERIHMTRRTSRSQAEVR